MADELDILNLLVSLNISKETKKNVDDLEKVFDRSRKTLTNIAKDIQKISKDQTKAIDTIYDVTFNDKAKQILNNISRHVKTRYGDLNANKIEKINKLVYNGLEYQGKMTDAEIKYQNTLKASLPEINKLSKLNARRFDIYQKQAQKAYEADQKARAKSLEYEAQIRKIELGTRRTDTTEARRLLNELLNDDAKTYDQIISLQQRLTNEIKEQTKVEKNNLSLKYKTDKLLRDRRELEGQINKIAAAGKYQFGSDFNEKKIDDARNYLKYFFSNLGNKTSQELDDFHDILVSKINSLQSDFDVAYSRANVRSKESKIQQDTRTKRIGTGFLNDDIENRLLPFDKELNNSASVLSNNVNKLYHEFEKLEHQIISNTISTGDAIRRYNELSDELKEYEVINKKLNSDLSLDVKRNKILSERYNIQAKINSIKGSGSYQFGEDFNKKNLDKLDDLYKDFYANIGSYSKEQLDKYFTELNQQIKTADSTLKNMISSANLGSNVSTIGTSVATSKNETTGLIQSIDENILSGKAAPFRSDDLNTKASVLRGEVLNLSNEFDKLNQRINQNNISTGDAAREYNNLNKRLKELKSEYRNQNTEIRHMNDNYQSLRKGIYDLQNVVDSFMFYFAAAFYAVARSIKVVLDEYIKFETAFNRFRGVNFQENMSKVNSLSDDFKKKAEEVAESTRFLTTEIIETGLEMSKIGFSIEQVTDSIDSIARAAEATGESMQLIGETVAGVINAFGLSAKDAEHITDVLSKASLDSAADFKTLNETLKYVAPVARATGNSFEDVVSLTAVLGQNMILSSQGGTVLKQSILRLLDVTPEAKEQLDKLGIAASNAGGSLKNQREILLELSDKLNGMPDVYKNMALAIIFGDRAVVGMSAELNNIAEDRAGFIRKMDEMEKSVDGLTKKIQDVSFAGLSREIAILSTNFNKLKISFGEAFNNEFVKGFLDVLVYVIQEISEFIKVNKAFVSTLSIAAVTITGFLAAFALFSKMLLTSVQAIILFKGGLAGFATANGIAAGSVMGLTGALTTLGMVIGGIFIALSVIIGAVWLYTKATKASREEQEVLAKIEEQKKQRHAEMIELLKKEQTEVKLTAKEYFKLAESLKREANETKNKLELLESQEKLLNKIQARRDDVFQLDEKEVSALLEIQDRYQGTFDINSDKYVQQELINIGNMIDGLKALRKHQMDLADSKTALGKNAKRAEEITKRMTDVQNAMASIKEIQNNVTGDERRVKLQKQINELLDEYASLGTELEKVDPSQDKNELLKRQVDLIETIGKFADKNNKLDKTTLEILKDQNDERQRAIDLMREQNELLNNNAYASKIGLENLGLSGTLLTKEQEKLLNELDKNIKEAQDKTTDLNEKLDPKTEQANKVTDETPEGSLTVKPGSKTPFVYKMESPIGEGEMSAIGHAGMFVPEASAMLGFDEIVGQPAYKPSSSKSKKQDKTEIKNILSKVPQFPAVKQQDVKQMVSKESSTLEEARKKLAQIAIDGAVGTTGSCYFAVGQALKKAGLDNPAAWGQKHAFQAINSMNSKYFKEIEITSKEQLKNLPAGTVVVWDKSPKGHTGKRSQSGHISIATGDGREVSDHITGQTIEHYGGGKVHAYVLKAASDKLLSYTAKTATAKNLKPKLESYTPVNNYKQKTYDSLINQGNYKELALTKDANEFDIKLNSAKETLKNTQVELRNSLALLPKIKELSIEEQQELKDKIIELRSAEAKQLNDIQNLRISYAEKLLDLENERSKFSINKANELNEINQQLSKLNQETLIKSVEEEYNNKKMVLKQEFDEEQRNIAVLYADSEEKEAKLAQSKEIYNKKEQLNNIEAARAKHAVQLEYSRLLIESDKKTQQLMLNNSIDSIEKRNALIDLQNENELSSLNDKINNQKTYGYSDKYIESLEKEKEALLANIEIEKQRSKTDFEMVQLESAKKRLDILNKQNQAMDRFNEATSKIIELQKRSNNPTTGLDQHISGFMSLSNPKFVKTDVEAYSNEVMGYANNELFGLNRENDLLKDKYSTTTDLNEQANILKQISDNEDRINAVKKLREQLNSGELKSYIEQQESIELIKNTYNEINSLVQSLSQSFKGTALEPLMEIVSGVSVFAGKITVATTGFADFSTKMNAFAKESGKEGAGFFEKIGNFASKDISGFLSAVSGFLPAFVDIGVTAAQVLFDAFTPDMMSKKWRDQYISTEKDILSFQQEINDILLANNNISQDGYNLRQKELNQRKEIVELAELQAKYDDKKSQTFWDSLPMMAIEQFTPIGAIKQLMGQESEFNKYRERLKQIGESQKLEQDLVKLRQEKRKKELDADLKFAAQLEAIDLAILNAETEIIKARINNAGKKELADKQYAKELAEFRKESTELAKAFEAGDISADELTVKHANLLARREESFENYKDNIRDIHTDLYIEQEAHNNDMIQLSKNYGKFQKERIEILSELDRDLAELQNEMLKTGDPDGSIYRAKLLRQAEGLAALEENAKSAREAIIDFNLEMRKLYSEYTVDKNDDFQFDLQKGLVDIDRQVDEFLQDFPNKVKDAENLRKQLTRNLLKDINEDISENINNKRSRENNIIASSVRLSGSEYDSLLQESKNQIQEIYDDLNAYIANNQNDPTASEEISLRKREVENKVLETQIKLINELNTARANQLNKENELYALQASNKGDLTSKAYYDIQSQLNLLAVEKKNIIERSKINKEAKKNLEIDLQILEEREKNVKREATKKMADAVISELNGLQETLAYIHQKENRNLEEQLKSKQRVLDLKQRELEYSNREKREIEREIEELKRKYENEDKGMYNALVSQYKGNENISKILESITNPIANDAGEYSATALKEAVSTWRKNQLDELNLKKDLEEISPEEYSKEFDRITGEAGAVIALAIDKLNKEQQEKLQKLRDQGKTPAEILQFETNTLKEEMNDFRDLLKDNYTDYQDNLMDIASRYKREEVESLDDEIYNKENEIEDLEWDRKQTEYELNDIMHEQSLSMDKIKDAIFDASEYSLTWAGSMNDIKNNLTEIISGISDKFNNFKDRISSSKAEVKDLIDLLTVKEQTANNEANYKDTFVNENMKDSPISSMDKKSGKYIVYNPDTDRWYESSSDSYKDSEYKKLGYSSSYKSEKGGYTPYTNIRTSDDSYNPYGEFLPKIDLDGRELVNWIRNSNGDWVKQDPYATKNTSQTLYNNVDVNISGNVYGVNDLKSTINEAINKSNKEAGWANSTYTTGNT